MFSQKIILIAFECSGVPPVPITLYGDSRVREIVLPFSVRSFPGKGLGGIGEQVDWEGHMGGIVVFAGGICDLTMKVGGGNFSEVIRDGEGLERAKLAAQTLQEQAKQWNIIPIFSRIPPACLIRVEGLVPPVAQRGVLFHAETA